MKEGMEVNAINEVPTSYSFVRRAIPWDTLYSLVFAQWFIHIHIFSTHTVYKFLYCYTTWCSMFMLVGSNGNSLLVDFLLCLCRMLWHMLAVISRPPLRCHGLFQILAVVLFNVGKCRVLGESFSFLFSSPAFAHGRARHRVSRYIFPSKFSLLLIVDKVSTASDFS